MQVTRNRANVFWFVGDNNITSRSFLSNSWSHLQDGEEEEVEGRGSEEEESSDDDDKSWVEEVRVQRRLLRAEERERNFIQRKEKRQQDRDTNLQSSDPVGNLQRDQRQPRFYQIKAGEEFRSFSDVSHKQKMQK